MSKSNKLMTFANQLKLHQNRQHNVFTFCVRDCIVLGVHVWYCNSESDKQSTNIIVNTSATSGFPFVSNYYREFITINKQAHVPASSVHTVHYAQSLILQNNVIVFSLFVCVSVFPCVRVEVIHGTL